MASTATLLGQFQLDGGIDPISVNSTGYTALIAALLYDDDGNSDWVTSASFNSVSMGAAIGSFQGASGCNIRVYRVTNPTQTTADVVVSRSAGTGGITQGRVLVIGIAGGNTTEAVGTPASSNSSAPHDEVSTQATDAGADLWLDFFVSNASGITATVGASQTSLQNAAATSSYTASSHKASDTMGWTYTPDSTGNASHMVVPIKAASGGGSSGTSGRKTLMGVGR